MALPFGLDRLFRRPAPPASRRGFDAGRPAGMRWTESGFGPVAAEVGASTATIRRRARQGMANNPHLSAAVNSWATAAVGAGITPTPQHPDPAIRAALVDLWNGWTQRADLAGVLSFPALLHSAVRALVVDGEALARLVVTPAGLRLHTLPAELLADESRDLAGGACIVSGVEFDATGRRVAFHLHRANPASPFGGMTPPVRVLADDVLHAFRPLLPGQARGVSHLAPVLLRANELDQLTDALLVGAKIGAMFAGVVTDMNATGPNPFAAEGEQRGTLLESGLEPGTLKVLPAGFDVKFATPQQAQQTAEFVRHQIRSIAAGLGLPAHLISADLAEANYGSLRAGMIAFRQNVESLQFGVLVPMLLQPVWNRLVSLAVLRGELDAPGFETDPAPFLAVEWLPPRAPWLDPKADAEAEAAMITAGLKSRRQAVAELGFDIETLDAEIASDREREGRLGLSFNKSKEAAGDA